MINAMSLGRGFAETAQVVLAKNYIKSYTYSMMIFACRNSTQIVVIFVELLYNGSMTDNIEDHERFGSVTRRELVRGSDGHDRHMEVSFSVPPFIADISVPPPSSDTLEIIAEVKKLLSAGWPDDRTGGILEGMLLRTEAVNSSRIEGHRTKMQNLCRAAAGVDAKPGALITLGNMRCILALAEQQPADISIEHILKDHAYIMEEADYAGSFRAKPEDIVRLGGDSIAEANYLPPPPETVKDLISDWIAFVSKSCGLVEKIAIAHCQFESIHPFMDGNGRVGRVATQRILLMNQQRMMPVSAALHAIQDSYMQTFAAYQEGNIDYAYSVHALAILSAAIGMKDHYNARNTLLDEWKEILRVSKQKPTSISEALKYIINHPVFTQDELQKGIGDISAATAKRIIDKLEENEILRRGKKSWNPEKQRNQQTWEPPEVFKLAEKTEKSIAKTAKVMIGGTSEKHDHSISDEENQIVGEKIRLPVKADMPSVLTSEVLANEEYFVTDPQMVAFQSEATLPSYTLTPPGVYRLIATEKEDGFILQGKVDRHIKEVVQDNESWVTIPSRPGIQPFGPLSSSVSDLFNLQFQKTILDRTVHRSEEPGWEEIGRWDFSEHENILYHAKKVIADDQIKLQSDAKELKARLKRREIIRRAVAETTST